MSFGKRLRAERTDRLRALTVIAAVAASLGMGTTAAPPTTPAPIGIGSGQAQGAAPREFIDEKTRRRRPAPVTNRVKGAGGLRVRIDSRKARRRLLMLMLGRDNSGRQWVRTRRSLRTHEDGRWLLNQPAWKLLKIAEKMGSLSA
jgi:hypothetical protein